LWAESPPALSRPVYTKTTTATSSQRRGLGPEWQVAIIRPSVSQPPLMTWHWAPHPGRISQGRRCLEHFPAAFVMGSRMETGETTVWCLPGLPSTSVFLDELTADERVHGPPCLPRKARGVPCTRYPPRPRIIRPWSAVDLLVLPLGCRDRPRWTRETSRLPRGRRPIACSRRLRFSNHAKKAASLVHLDFSPRHRQPLPDV